MLFIQLLVEDYIEQILNICVTITNGIILLKCLKLLDSTPCNSIKFK